MTKPEEEYFNWHIVWFPIREARYKIYKKMILFAECNKPLCIFCAKNQLDLKTTLVVIVVADEQVKKITNTFKPLKKVKGEKGHE